MDEKAKKCEIEYCERLKANGGVIGFLLSESEQDRYSAQLYLLKICFSAFVYFLSVFCSTKVRFDSPEINDLYLNKDFGFNIEMFRDIRVFLRFEVQNPTCQPFWAN